MTTEQNHPSLLGLDRVLNYEIRWSRVGQNWEAKLRYKDGSKVEFFIDDKWGPNELRDHLRELHTSARDWIVKRTPHMQRKWRIAGSIWAERPLPEEVDPPIHAGVIDEQAKLVATALARSNFHRRHRG